MTIFSSIFIPVLLFVAFHCFEVLFKWVFFFIFLAREYFKWASFHYFPHSAVKGNRFNKFCLTEIRIDSATWYSTHKCSTRLRFNCEKGVFK
jgi:hypothetical protein